MNIDKLDWRGYDFLDNSEEFSTATEDIPGK